jgi:hypothetical protein
MLLSARKREAGSNIAERKLCINLISAAICYAVEPKKADKLANLLRCKPEPETSSSRWHKL